MEAINFWMFHEPHRHFIHKWRRFMRHLNVYEGLTSTVIIHIRKTPSRAFVFFLRRNFFMIARTCLFVFHFSVGLPFSAGKFSFEMLKRAYQTGKKKWKSELTHLLIFFLRLPHTLAPFPYQQKLFFIIGHGHDVKFERLKWKSNMREEESKLRS